MSDLSYLSLSTSLVPRIDKCIKKKTIEKVKKKMLPQRILEEKVL